MIENLREESLKISVFEDKLLSFPTEDLAVCRPIILNCIKWVLSPPNLEVLNFKSEERMLAGSLTICIKKLLQFESIQTSPSEIQSLVPISLILSVSAHLKDTQAMSLINLIYGSCS